MSERELLEDAWRLFGTVQRPMLFTPAQHCDECAEHDATLQAHTPQSIGYDELGSPAWDPVCFMTPEAYLYYFPALVRLALDPEASRYYLDQFLFGLEMDGPGHERWRCFNTAQRQFVVRLLEHLIDVRAEQIDANGDADNVLRVRTLWAAGG